MENTPRGYNPIGQSAPGLPRHDVQIPGHVSGGPSQPLGGADPSGPAGGGFNTAYTGPGLPDWATKPIGRFLFFGWMYLTAPVEAAMYPIAGIAGLVGAGVFYLFARIVGGGYDTRHSWAWTGCFLGVVALMRFETNFENANPAYKLLRHWLRLAFIFIGMIYFGIQEQGNSFGTALVVAAVGSVIAHFVLRSKWLRFVWHGLQQTSWMRKSIDVVI
ncbi:MAG TPA: hypothetical protein VGM97_07895 [Steroidobacteraceae bacterium]|jgi:hypothetical protein